MKATKKSQCKSCDYQLRWYDLIPFYSWLILRGKCSKCKGCRLFQYPVVEVANVSLYMLIFAVNGWNLVSVLYCLTASALFALSVIDFRTFEIPFEINGFIMVLGLVRMVIDFGNWTEYVIGFFAVSIVLQILLVASGGRAIGGGDVKLMAVCGLLLGWKLIFVAFLVGCIAGAVIHLIRMKVSGVDHVLAMGPYLSAGVLTAALWGNEFLNWYFESLLI